MEKGGLEVGPLDEWQQLAVRTDDERRVMRGTSWGGEFDPTGGDGRE
jgi:hypothetical protein